MRRAARPLPMTYALRAFVLALAMMIVASAAAAEMLAIDKVAIEAAFARADTNADGKLSREEAVRFPEIAARFDELDKNKDGFLSLDEFAVGATLAAK